MDNVNFAFTDYDCLGFDLDNTLAYYHIQAIADLVHKLLIEYLIKIGHSKEHLLKPFDYDFVQRGIIIDLEKGNLLKLSSSGEILKATHGTKLLTTEEIEAYYPNRRWEYADAFVKDPLESWEGPSKMKIRAINDYFDLAVAMTFARLVDSVGEYGNRSLAYLFADIYAGLWWIYLPEEKPGEMFREMKENSEIYIHQCSSTLLEWLKKLRDNGKKLFMITSSDMDYVSFIASRALGSDWKNYFDIMITDAKKPGFFNGNREFLSVESSEPVPPEQLQEGGVYAIGNWKGLHEFLSKLTSKSDPKCVYVGDNLLQDIYAASAHLDAVTVNEELDVEKYRMKNHPGEEIISSEFWESFFKLNNHETIWSKVIKEHSKLCVPNLDYVAKLPIDTCYNMQELL